MRFNNCRPAYGSFLVRPLSLCRRRTPEGGSRVTVLASGIAALFALSALAAAPAGAQTDFSLVNPGYNRFYANILGSLAFEGKGSNQTIPLTPGMPLLVGLDSGSSWEKGGLGTANNDPTLTFFGTIVTPVTLGGVTHDVTFEYLATPNGSGGPEFLAGSPVRFVFPDGYVTVTPLAEKDSAADRLATFTFTAAPEPGSLALLSTLAFPIIGIVRRRKA